MSLILEALKKSEAERGARPRPPAESSAPRRGVSRKLVAGMAAIAVLGAVAGWWGARQLLAPEASLAGSDPAPAVPAVTGERTGSDDGALTAARRAAPSVAAESEVEPPPTAASGSHAAAAAAEEAGDVSAALLATAGPALDSGRNEPSATAPAPLVAVTLTPSSDAGSGSERAATPTPAADPLPAASAPAEPTNELPRFDQLPGLLAEFGKLELNMLVSAARPEARFALINLQRFEEGDQIQPGLELKQIRRDGVVLSLRGQDVLLPSGH